MCEVLVALRNCCLIRHALAKSSGVNRERKDLWLFSRKAFITIVLKEGTGKHISKKVRVRREDGMS